MRCAFGSRPRRLAGSGVAVGVLAAALAVITLGVGLGGCDDSGGLPLLVPGTDPIAAPCASPATCIGGACLGYPSGYCSQPCGIIACPDGSVCLVRGGGSFCHKRCAQASECRAGYQCALPALGGACIPACTSDGDCGAAYLCAAGSCTPRPGKAQGEPCGADVDCAGGHCEPTSKTCEIPCVREEDCPASQTCFYNPVDSDGNSFADKPLPLCRPRRAGGLPSGAACLADKECERGQCQYGVCTVLCAPGGTCAQPLLCKAGFAQLDDGPAPLRQCLPARGVLDVPLGDGFIGFGVPEHAVSLGLWAANATEDFAFYTGFASLSDDTTLLSSVMQDPYKSPLRYFPAEGASFAYLSNSPLAKFKPGIIYNYVPFSQNKSGKGGPFTVRARVRVSDRPAITSGHIAVHVFITDLTGGCYKSPLNAANAHATLGAFEARFTQVFAQAQIAIDEWKYVDSKAPSTFNILADHTSPELSALLKAATTGDARDVLEIVLVRKINDLGAQPGFEVLGIAGGVPAASGIPGTVHSGATVSISPLCMNNGQVSLALVAAHEMGHTLGLFHTIEADKVHTDQMTDNDNDGMTNLMYWAEGSTTGRLSPQQSAVLLTNPSVKD